MRRRWREGQWGTGVDTKQILLVDHRASEALRLTSPEQKSLAQGTIISKIHSEP